MNLKISILQLRVQNYISRKLPQIKKALALSASYIYKLLLQLLLVQGK